VSVTPRAFALALVLVACGGGKHDTTTTEPGTGDAASSGNGGSSGTLDQGGSAAGGAQATSGGSGEPGAVGSSGGRANGSGGTAGRGGAHGGSGGDSMQAGQDAGAGADPGPEDVAGLRAKAQDFAPDPLPASIKDVSNAYADDTQAAALGQKLFADVRFSGALLDLDDDGGPNSLGLRGDTGKVSCGGCHEPEHAFLDTRSVFKQLSLGTGWTHRRTPSLFDVGQAKIVMWGGRHSTLYAQVFGPLENPVEMNSSRLFVAEQIAALYRDEYEAIFGAGTLDALADAARFPPLTPETTGCRLTSMLDHPRATPPDPLYECHGMPGDAAEYDAMAAADQELVTRIVVNLGKAVAAYERTLHCGPGRFDAWAHGDDQALSAAEQRGFELFAGKAACVSCHSGPYFSDQRFHALGLAEGPTRAGILNDDDHGALRDLQAAKDDPLGITGSYSDGDDGRLPASIDSTLDGAFRTPTLRCVSRRPSFMHSALLRTLADVVAFHDRGGDAPGSYPGKSELSPLGLSDGEQSDLVAFLGALDGSGAP
jgi:cytochrome c peroxidase